MQKNLANNVIYNMLFQFFTLFLPVITTPYISRTLGLEQNGIYSFVETIVTLFTIFGSIGTFLYGCRKIAYVRNDKEKLSQAAYEIILLKLILLVPLLIIYIVTYNLIGQHQLYFSINIITIVSSAIEITWFFNGIEEFKTVTIRNFIIKILFVILLFFLINDSSDLWKYVMLVSISGFLGNLSMWFLLPKYLLPIKEIKKLHPIKHLKESFVLFIPQTANYIYSLSDKVMIGFLTPTLNNVGIYDYAYRIIKMIVGILQSIGYVLLARIANLSANKDKYGIKNYINKSIKFTMFLALPFMFGLIGIAEGFVPLYLGKEYMEVCNVIYVIAPLIILTSLNSILGVQLLLAIKKDREYTIATTLGALCNIVLNIYFIPKYGIYGACITSLLSELLVFSIQLKYSKDYVSLFEILKSCKIYFAISVIIFIICKIIFGLQYGLLFKLLLQIFISATLYFVILYVISDEIIILIKNKIYTIIKKKGTL